MDAQLTDDSKYFVNDYIKRIEIDGKIKRAWLEKIPEGSEITVIGRTHGPGSIYFKIACGEENIYVGPKKDTCLTRAWPFKYEEVTCKEFEFYKTTKAYRVQLELMK